MSGRLRQKHYSTVGLGQRRMTGYKYKTPGHVYNLPTVVRVVVNSSLNETT